MFPGAVTMNLKPQTETEDISMHPKREDMLPKVEEPENSDVVEQLTQIINQTSIEKIYKVQILTLQNERPVQDSVFDALRDKNLEVQNTEKGFIYTVFTDGSLEKAKALRDELIKNYKDAQVICCSKPNNAKIENNEN